ncbi:hypothetical protein FO519_002916 [Halicephalobus sp. NKZ332]|nr:hypothetical protein FO519_002916 [Halicephalobus sp. NKZ332]
MTGANRMLKVPEGDFYDKRDRQSERRRKRGFPIVSLNRTQVFVLIMMTPEEVLQCYLNAYRFVSESQRFLNPQDQSFSGIPFGQLPMIPNVSSCQPIQQIPNFSTSCSLQKLTDFSIASLMSSPSTSTSSMKNEQSSPSSTASSISLPSPRESKRKNMRSKLFSSTNGRPIRCVVNSETAKPLDTWLRTHLNDPYPTDQEVEEFMKETGFEKQQIRGWFTNHRRRIAKEYARRGESLPWEKKPGPIRSDRQDTP